MDCVAQDGVGHQVNSLVAVLILFHNANSLLKSLGILEVSHHGIFVDFIPLRPDQSQNKGLNLHGDT